MSATHLKLVTPGDGRWQRTYDWRIIASAPENVVLMTKIDDAQGVRNEARLIRKGNLWWHEDGSMYVYYRPTHWSPL